VEKANETHWISADAEDMTGFPRDNSLYAHDQVYRRSEEEPFGDRSLVVAPDDQWEYGPVRRLALFVERSLAESLQWARIEPSGPALWARVSGEVEDLLSGLFRRGELRGDKPWQAYFVKCGVETMTQSDVDNGHLNVVIGVAPVKPAEFVIIAIAAFAGPPAKDVGRLPKDAPWRWRWPRRDE
jgi:hypothetical protein